MSSESIIFRKVGEYMITIIDNDEMCIKVSESFVTNTKTPGNKSLSDYILNQTTEKFELYKKIFNVEKLEKITFVLFDNIEDYKKYYRQLNKKEPPEYSKGAFDPINNLSYSVQHSNSMYNTSWWMHAVCVNAHEAFHIYYKKYIYNDDRIIWFDEGMAQFLSGENDNWINNEEIYKETFINFMESYKPIYNLNERIQGNYDISDDLIFQRKGVFEGYKASLMIIKYLVEINGYEYIFKLLKNNEHIREIGNNILDEMIMYYKNKYNFNNIYGM